MGLKVAILGAKGIGKYHAREFVNAGCEVVSILGRTKESVNLAVLNLQKNFGINPRPYDNFKKMLYSEKPDAISICTPQDTHEGFIMDGLERGLHVFCEKPLIIGKETYKKTLELLDLSQNIGKILTVNTQWPSIFETFREHDAFNEPVRKLEIYMEPGERGREMLIDHLPHANSISIRLTSGKITNLKFEKKDEDIAINFNYGECDIRYHFKYNPNRPRAIEFKFNDEKFIRKIGENYQQSFESQNKVVNIEDPLKKSIEMFVSAIHKGIPPLITRRDMLESAKLTDLILLEYDKT